MKRISVNINKSEYPEVFHGILSSADIFDSSCSEQARVIFINKDKGYYLKSSEKGRLRTEAEMTSFFHQKGLSVKVLQYISEDKDWLLTQKAEGEDCTFPLYLENPKKLCDTLAENLRNLHDVDSVGCPVTDRTQIYLKTARDNYGNGKYDKSLFPDNWGFSSAEEAYRVIEERAHLLKNDVLIHGDYCLPNIMLKDWKFSAFIDLDSAGIGDRHIDLFWGIWSLFYNLKTDKYADRFLDAYGRDKVDKDVLKLIAAIEAFG